VCFSPDGLYVAAGLLDGHVFLYETADLKYYTQIACIRKNKKLSAKDKRKVTGVSFIASRGLSSLAADPSVRRPVTATKDKYNLLVTTNDSRIRIFSMSDFTLVLKLKGPTNSSRQIRATSSLDGRSIICGSDTGDVFLWRLPAADDSAVRGAGGAQGQGPGVGIDAETESSSRSGGQSAAPSSSLVECHLIPAQLKTTSRLPALPASAAASSSSSGKEVYPPCTSTLLVPLNAIHLTHTSAGHSAEDTATSLRAISGKQGSSRYSPEDLSCLAILTAEYDGSLHVLYTPG
jgi:WD40 repeat protein